jgi:hypothetical protein
MKTGRIATTFCTLAALSLAATHAHAKGGSGGNTAIKLVSTGVDADAAGRAKLRIKSPSDGRFEVQVAMVDPGAAYEVVVDGIRVGDIVGADDGTGRARFRTSPHSSRETLLGFDPRGSIIVIRNAAGEDVLAGDIPVDTNPANDGKIVCCVPDDSGAECEDRTADECVTRGGNVSTATSCLPNPCDTTTAPSEDKVICCIPDDSGPECEDRSIEECSAASGIVVKADTCAGDPCSAVPAVDPDTRCCLPDDSGNECEDRSPAECLASGGVDIGPGVCSADACASVTIPTGHETIRIRCEQRSSRSKISVDGAGLANGSYTAHVVSGASEAGAPVQNAVTGEVEFDFASEADDIAAGATAIPGSFLAGSAPSVTGQIVDANGTVVVEGTATCTVR